MSGRARIIAFCACCAAGWASLVLLFPGLDASAVRWRTRASRNDVIAAARLLATRYEVDTSGWNFYVTAQSSRERILARLERPSSRILPKFTSMEYVVVASRPGSPANLRAVLSSDLQPVSFRAFSPRGGRGPGKGERGKRPERQRPDGERPDSDRPTGTGAVPAALSSPLTLPLNLRSMPAPMLPATGKQHSRFPPLTGCCPPGNGARWTSPAFWLGSRYMFEGAALFAPIMSCRSPLL